MVGAQVLAGEAGFEVGGSIGSQVLHVPEVLDREVRHVNKCTSIAWTDARPVVASRPWANERSTHLGRSAGLTCPPPIRRPPRPSTPAYSAGPTMTNQRGPA